MNKQYLSFIGIYIFSFFSIGGLLPFLAQYLSEIGFNGFQIGTITASATAVAIISAPFWGAIYEKNDRSKKLFYALYVVALILVLSLSFIKSYALFLCVYIVAFFFESPIRPLNDAITLHSGYAFGNIRKWGAVGFALGVFIAGQLTEKIGLVVIFPMYSIAFVLSLMSFMMLKTKDPLESIEGAIYFEEKSSLGNVKALLRNKKYLNLVICGFFVNGTVIAHLTYFGFLFIDVGGTIAGIGLAFLLMVGSEIPMMGLSEKLVKKIPMEKLIIISMIISALRFFWYSTSPPPELLIGTFFLHGIVNGIIFVQFAKYISELVEKKMIHSAITLYTSISSSASSIVCLLLGGIFLADFGGDSVYLFLAIFNVFGIALYLAFGLYKK